MRVQPTKKLARELNKAIKNNYCMDHINYIELPATRSNIYNMDLDFNSNGDLIYKAIEIVYKPEMYALPQIVNTSDLIQIFRSSRSANFNDFASEFIEQYNI